jgi:hypothetical protein
MTDEPVPEDGTDVQSSRAHHSRENAMMVSLRDYIEAVLEEQRRALLLAQQDRDRRIRALRKLLSQNIKESHENLREYIQFQLTRVEAALASADALEISRVSAVTERVQMLHDSLAERIETRIATAEKTAVEHTENLRRERELITRAQKEAIAKAEVATEKRFELANEWRQQSADRELSRQEDTARLASTFMPREIAEAQLSELRRAISDLTEKVNKLV